MRFPRDEFRHVEHLPEINTIAWRRMDEPDPDDWTTRLQQFKDGNKRALVGARAALLEALPHLDASGGRLVDRSVGIVAALGHAHTGPRTSSFLVQLARKLSEDFGWVDLTGCIAKESHRALKFIHDDAQRAAEVANKYTATSFGDEVDTVLILDDLTTAGLTTDEIARSILAVDPSVSVSAVALGKNERPSFARGWGHAIANDNVPEFITRAWDTAANRCDEYRKRRQR